MAHLPEPRRFGGASVTDELALAAIRAARSDALEAPRAAATLRASVVHALELGEEARVLAVLRQAPDAASCRLLTEALARAIDGAGGEAGVVARAFALPVVLVASAARKAVVPGRLRDVEALQQLFERTHALGPTLNFGLSAGLCTLEALESLSPLVSMRAAREARPQAWGTLLPAADIAIEPGGEQTHLRFIVGAGLTAPESPGFAETAAHIEPWGQDCARVLQQQLATPGVQLLALPRPPQGLVGASRAGRSAQLEIAFSLFASNAVRRFRLSVGDPVAILSAHEGAEIRATLSSPFDDELVEGFRWPLHPADDLPRVQALMLELLADMRVQDVRMIERVLPSCRDNGALMYPRSDEWERLAGSAAH